MTGSALADLTLNELNLLLEETQRWDAIQAWRIAALTRTSKFPTLDELLPDDKTDLTKKEKTEDVQSFLDMAQADLIRRREAKHG